MPTSSVVAAVSTAVYILSASLFLGLAASPLQTVAEASQVRLASSLADGVQSVVNSLRPGMTSALSFTLPFGAPVRVSFRGQSVVVTAGGSTQVRSVEWQLPDVQLEAGVMYSVSLRGDTLEVQETGVA